MKMSALRVALATCQLGACGVGKAENLLLDPSFDLSTPGTQLNPHWGLTVNMPDGASSAAQFQDAPWASYPLGTDGIGLWFRSFEGAQAPGDPLAQATLTQSVPSSPGIIYELSVFFRKEAHYRTARTLLALDFFDGSELVGTVERDLNPLHPTDGTFQQYSLTGVAPVRTDRVQARIQMVDGQVAPANPQSGMFDDVCLMVIGKQEPLNLLLDPGFELSTAGTQTNPFWQLIVNTPDGASPAGQYQDAPWASYPLGTDGIGLWFRSFEGAQSPGEPLAQLTLVQSVPVSPGAAYELSAWFRMETNYRSASTLLALDFMAGRTVLGSIELDLNPLHPADGSFQQFSLTGVAPAGAATVRVRAEMIDGQTAPSNPQSAMFDDFFLSIVEDPLAITAIDLVNADTIEILFKGTPGETYALRSTPDPSVGFPNSVTPSGGSLTTDATGHGAVQFKKTATELFVRLEQ